jgi:hypothetical protein
MKNPNTKLALDLGLPAIGLSLMCIGNRWLFFVGLAVIAVGGTVSSRSRKTVSGFERLITWLLCIGGVSLLLWLFSFGREAVPWSFAALIMFSTAMAELYYWRINRKKTHEA